MTPSAGDETLTRAATLALASVVEPGSGQLLTQVRDYGPVEVWSFLLRTSADSALAERARRYRPAVMQRDMHRHGLRFLVPGDPEWPACVDDLAWSGPVGDVTGGAPLGLWVAGPGNLRDLTTRSVAMVGSRSSTATGDVVTVDLSAGVAERGVTVVSGGAYGIDAAAHRGALSTDGATIAVMAGGLDEVYPSGNAPLLERVRDEFLLVSENPPNQRPSRVRFLARNRLIAALGQATVVVEAQVRSGARNTVAWAHSLQRQVLAVPGAVTSSQSETPNQLIRDGEATLVTCAAHILEALAPLGDPAPRPETPTLPIDGLSPGQKAVHEAFPARSARSVDELAYDARVNVRECMAALTVLEMRGLALPTDDGRWRLVRQPR